MSLTFDAATHTYRFHGRVVPGVTKILDRLHDFAGVPMEVLDAAKTRGSFVHVACHYHDEGDLKVDSVDERERGYVEAWVRFCTDHRAKWASIEKPVHHPVLGYAGTPDRFGTIAWRGEPTFLQVDIKTAEQAHPCWGLQTAAYNAAAGYNCTRLTCQLRIDGTYRLREWPDPLDWPTFVSLINLDNWKRKHNL